jgi:hypothetical protein
MITSLEINQYIDSCVNNYKNNFDHNIDNNDAYDSLMFKYAPTDSYFLTKYGDIKSSEKNEYELMNMNELYKREIIFANTAYNLLLAFCLLTKVLADFLVGNYLLN